MCICFTIVINAADVPHRPHVVDITYQGKYAEGGSTYKNDCESCYYYFLAGLDLALAASLWWWWWCGCRFSFSCISFSVFMFFLRNSVAFYNIVDGVVKVWLKTINIQWVIVENGTVGYWTDKLYYHEKHYLGFFKLYSGALDEWIVRLPEIYWIIGAVGCQSLFENSPA